MRLAEPAKVVGCRGTLGEFFDEELVEHGVGASVDGPLVVLPSGHGLGPYIEQGRKVGRRYARRLADEAESLTGPHARIGQLLGHELVEPGEGADLEEALAARLSLLAGNERAEAVADCELHLLDRPVHQLIGLAVGAPGQHPITSFRTSST